jgi:hypothetical protein
MLKPLLFASACLGSTSALAQQQCQSFEQAVQRLPNVAPRGEYETTAQYEARRSASVGGSGPLIILKTPEGRDKYIRYDADAGRLGIQTYAFDNTGFDAWYAFYGTPAAQALDPSTLGNLDVVISQDEKAAGTYQGQNAYGARWTVTRINRTTQAIFDRALTPREGMSRGLFPSADSAPYMAGFLEISPEEAQRIKPVMKLAFVVEPREPYVVRNNYSGRGRITIQNPNDVTENSTVLIGDIQCGLALDANNKVLGAFPTR